MIMAFFFFWALLFAALCIGAKSAVGARHSDGVLLFAESGPEDDSDMKIAGAAPRREEPDNSAQELERQRLCGNLDKAAALSAELAKKIIDADGDSAFGNDAEETCGMRMQRRLLLAFVVDCELTENIRSSVLRMVVINRFYEELKKNMPDFYEDIRGSASFSFYYLCIRGGGDVQSRIGKTFAMLVGREGDRLIREFGEALYLHFTDIVEQAISAGNFA